MEHKNGIPHLKTLTLCLQKMISDGYVNDFSYVDDGIMLHQTRKIYKPEEIKVTNTLKFESADPDDNAVLYVIETSDGMKGTLVDALGIYPKTEEDRFAILLDK
ncbi:MAG TPA: phosphoribosylpyrophosphate synthetase [Chitinophagaceae bacterium]|nr:phosphoribosylpyrophosphate synthetase [Chitinophagaceae bacterium]